MRFGHEYYMQQALTLARQASGHTAPNPMVGAVLVHGDRIIGEGWHHHYGADHAEVNCLKNVADADKHLVPESTMYVNLEPCAHFGITPPCATRLVAERVRAVVIANKDPFEQVSGRGINILADAGIAVTTGTLDAAGWWLNRRFFCYHIHKRPYIILKWAQNAEGFLAPADRSRLQITGADSQQLVHQWRTEEGAIMVGHNTAMNDNPRLTARLHKGRQPLRIALDRNLRIPATHHLYDNTAATWIISEQKEQLQGNVHILPMKFDDTLIEQVLHKLYDAKILSLIVEGGAALLDTFTRQGMWDEARIFTGNATITDGIYAPEVIDASPAFSQSAGSDQLQVFVNNKSKFPYAPGMSL